MDRFGEFLNSQPFIALFLVIGLGYAAGRVKIADFSLGLGAVLFVGLGIGAIAPKAAPPSLVGLIGLALFLYGIGIQYGRDFMRGLVSPFGIKANLLALVAVLSGCATAYFMADIIGFGLERGAGIVAGAMTSTASLHAAMEAAGDDTPTIGYVIAYPFGVFGPILCLYLFKKLFRPEVDIAEPRRLIIGEASAEERELEGVRIADLLQRADTAGVEVLAIRRDNKNLMPDPDLTLRADDIIAIAGFPETLDELEIGGERVVAGDRRDFDYAQAFVSRQDFAGKTLAEIMPPDDLEMKIIRLRRGDSDLMPRPDVVIQYGDQVGVLIAPGDADKLRRFFGDSVEAQASFDFVALSVGMVLGTLLGLISIPVPGVGQVSLGTAGGPLIMALILGYIGRLGPLNWHIPLAANIVLRNFGNSLFLASVGLSSGGSIAQNLGANILAYFLTGIVVLLVVVFVVLLVGYFILKLNFDDLAGIVSGSIGNSAILAFANKIAPTNRPNISYAMIFPGVGTVLKLVVVQIMVAHAGGG